MNISHEGWLEKQGEGVLSFYRKRWFCLQGLRLFYFKSPTQKLQVSGLGQRVLSSDFSLPSEPSKQDIIPTSTSPPLHTQSLPSDLHPPRRATIGASSDSLVSNTSSTPTGFIDLETIKRVDVEIDQLIFKLVPHNERGRIWNLKASTEKELKKWVDLIRPLCEKDVVLPELLRAISSNDFVLQRDAIRMLYPFLTTDRYPHVISKLLEAARSSNPSSSSTTVSSSNVGPKDEFQRNIFFSLSREVIIAISSSKLISKPYSDGEVIESFLTFLLGLIPARSFELQLTVIDALYYMLSLDYEFYSEKLAPSWLKIFGLLSTCPSPSLEKRILIILSFLTSQSNFVSYGLDIGKPELKYLIQILEITEDKEKASLVLTLLVPLSHLDNIKTKLGSRSKLKTLIVFYNKEKDESIRSLVQSLVDNLVTHKKVQKKYQIVASKLGVEANIPISSTVSTTSVSSASIVKSPEIVGQQSMFESVRGVNNPMESQIHPISVSNLVIKHAFNERRFENFQECLLEKINRSFETASDGLGVKFKLQSFKISIPTNFDATGWKVWFWFDQPDILYVRFCLTPDITLNLSVSSGVGSVNVSVSNIHFEGTLLAGFDKPYTKTPTYLTFPSMPKFTCKLSLTKAFGVNVAHIFVCQIEKFIQTSMLAPNKYTFED